MSILVTYYSKTGNTAGLAHQIATRLQADEKPILDRDQAKGFWGTAIGALRAVLGQAGSLAEPQIDPAEYDLVLIGTPVWAAAPVPAVNAWIDRHSDRCKQVAFFATEGGFGETRTFSRLEKRMAKAPIACLAVTEDELAKDEIDDKLDRFISEITSEAR